MKGDEALSGNARHCAEPRHARLSEHSETISRPKSEWETVVSVKRDNTRRDPELFPAGDGTLFLPGGGDLTRVILRAILN